MQAFILNTESGQTFNLEVMDPRVDMSGIQSSYSAAAVPGVNLQPIYWSGNTAPVKSLRFWLEGPQAQDTLTAMQTLNHVVPEKHAPPICRIQIGSIGVTRCVITEVNAVADLGYSQKGKPHRIEVRVSYQEVGLEAIAR